MRRGDGVGGDIQSGINEEGGSSNGNRSKRLCRDGRLSRPHARSPYPDGIWESRGLCHNLAFRSGQRVTALISPSLVPPHPGGPEAEVTDTEEACCCRGDGPGRCQHGSGWVWRFHRGGRAGGGLRGGVGAWYRECGSPAPQIHIPSCAGGPKCLPHPQHPLHPHTTWRPLLCHYCCGHG